MSVDSSAKPNRDDPRDNPRDDPQAVADYLILEHGQERALRTAMEGAVAAQSEGDNYGLSVWREVKRILRERAVVEPRSAV